MKISLRFIGLSVTLLLGVMLVAVIVVRNDTVNVMHPALDKLSAVTLSERWSHPEMLKLREFGVKAVPALRQVLREKNSPIIRLLLWVKAKWPGATKYYPYFPDAKKLSERRWAACQVLQTLGPAGRRAAPEIIEILRSNDLGDLNSATMALWAIGMDEDIRDRLEVVLEKGVPERARSSIVGALGSFKPPSACTLKALAATLSDSSPFVQRAAIDSIARLGVGTPEIVSALKHIQSESSDPLTCMSASAALWELEKDPAMVLASVFRILEGEIGNFSGFQFGGGDGGQGVSASEQLFMKGGDLLQKMPLSDSEKSRALGILERCCEKSGRIFIRMLLLPSMMKLGFQTEKGLEVCRTGLDRREEYYRLQAAQLLADFGENHSLGNTDLDALIHDRDVGVRVYAAKVHWLKNRQAEAVVPVLIEALDRKKHQSYYYAQIQPAALKVLGDIGPEAREATVMLGKMLNDPNPAIVKLASETLLKIKR